MSAAIIIPAFNEAASIAAVVKAVARFGTPVVVDDGSSDETGNLARDAGAVVVRQECNRGYDAAIAAGFAKADEIGADKIITIDADGQIDPAAIPQALKQLDAVDLVIGVRDAGAARWSEALFNAYARVRFGVPDILCGLKAFRIEEYRQEVARVSEPSVYTALALALLRRKRSHAMVPVSVRPREGVSRFGAAWRGEWRIFKALCIALADDIGRR